LGSLWDCSLVFYTYLTFIMFSLIFDSLPPWKMVMPFIDGPFQHFLLCFCKILRFVKLLGLKINIFDIIWHKFVRVLTSVVEFSGQGVVFCYRWQSLRNTNPGTSKSGSVSLFWKPSDWQLSYWESQSECSSNQLLIKSRTLGSQDLYFLNLL
jgi:hypothetical protein